MQDQTRKPTRCLSDIDPTVFIGLGGAGGQVLARVRRMFTEEFEDELDPNGPSPLQFLLLDTDDFDKLPAAVRSCLPDRHRDFLSLSHFNPARYASRQLAIPGSDLRRWFDTRALHYLEDGMIRDGASRQRMLGRLCLHYSFREVEQRIRNKLDEAADARVIAKSRRVRPEPRPLHVFLVASSCGGTGSASFLDVACLVHRIARDRGTTPNVTGFLFLPFPYIEANADLDPALESFYQHNAWAFFEELNHFLLRPEHVSEYVLDLDRPEGHPPRPFDYGLEIFRTVYLLNDRIPQAGRMDFAQMYAYAARGIFDLFLAPEEGAVQSHYSNIKDKLKERDRIHGLVKRFATFGYAECRLQDDRLPRRLAEAAVTTVWNALTSNAGPGAATAAADELDRRVETELDRILADPIGWSPPPFDPQKKVNEARGIGELQSIAHKMLVALRIALEGRTEELPPEAALQERLSSAILGWLDERLTWPPLGVEGEKAVLEAFRERVRDRARALGGEATPSPLESDDTLKALIEDLSQQAARVDTRSAFRQLLGARPEALTPADFAGRLRSFATEATDAAHQRVLHGARTRLSAALDRIAGVDGILSARIEQLRRLAAALRGAGDDPSRDAGPEPVPTAREYPPPAEVAGVVKKRSGDVWAVVHPVVEQAQRAGWSAFVIDPARHNPAGAAAFRRTLVELWSSEIAQRPALGSTEELRDPLAGGEGCGGTGYLRDLLALSSPACPIERTGLHRLDTIPQIPSVIWPWDYEGKEAAVRGCLGIAEEVAVNPSGPRKRVAVLQAWYGFSSRALEGMETLRRSYLSRDRDVSLPHIHAEWNERGVGCTGDALSILSDVDLLHAARILALSHAAADPSKGPAFPGIEVIPDRRDDAQHAALLSYTPDACALALVWRRLWPRDGHRETWDIQYAAPEAGGACGNGAGGRVSPAGVDLARDLGAYLASDARAEHARLLEEIACLERIGMQPDSWYAAAYRDYLAKLMEWIQTERDRRRNRHLPLLIRLADVLHRYLHRNGDEGRSL